VQGGADREELVMTTATRRLGRALRALVALGLCAAPLAVRAEPITYAGKQIQFLIGTGAGDSYDVLARLLAIYLTKYLPGSPVIVPIDQPGAGSLVAVNTMYNTAGPDGTILSIGQRPVPIMPLLKMPGPQFDPLKMAYIGSMSQETTICYVQKRTGINSVADARGKEIVVGTMGAGTELTNFTATISHMLGIGFKVVRGYGSSGEIDMAVDRGELQGRCGVSWSSFRRTHSDWIASGAVKIILQISMDRSPDLPDVPALGELVSAKDKPPLELLLSQEQFARPVFGPPNMSAARLAVLRKAFDESMADKGLQAEAAKEGLPIVKPMKGEDVEKLIARLYASDPDVVHRARQLVGTD
jgi:tripartite-type tricarboxylate transporter receptor subunit TctC